MNDAVEPTASTAPVEPTTPAVSGIRFQRWAGFVLVGLGLGVAVYFSGALPEDQSIAFVAPRDFRLEHVSYALHESGATRAVAGATVDAAPARSVSHTLRVPSGAYEVDVEATARLDCATSAPCPEVRVVWSEHARLELDGDPAELRLHAPPSDLVDAALASPPNARR